MSGLSCSRDDGNHHSVGSSHGLWFTILVESFPASPMTCFRKSNFDERADCSNHQHRFAVTEGVQESISQANSQK